MIRQERKIELWGLLKDGLTILGFPGGAVVKNPPASAGGAGDVVRSLGQEDPRSRNWQSTPPVFLPGKPHGLEGYSPQDCK